MGVKPEPQVASWKGMIEKKASKVLGASAVDLNSTEAHLRWHEGELSNWVCDVVAEDYSADPGVHLDLGVPRLLPRLSVC